MLDKYLEGLVKTAGVQEKLDSHLQELVKQAAQEQAQEEFFKNASVADLARLAGVKLPENVCGGCGAEMEKLGSVFQCECGRMKKTAEGHTKQALVPGGLAARAVGALKAVPGALASKAKAIKSTYQTAAHPGGVGQMTLPGMKPQGGGVLKGLQAVAAQHPGVVAGAAGTVGLGAGAGLAGGGQKTAAVDESGNVRPGWFSAQRGMTRAMRASDKGIKSLLATPELIGERATKGLTHSLAGLGIGTAGGAGIGAIASLLSRGKLPLTSAVLGGTIIGGAAGATIGDVHGQLAADKKFLGGRGITPHWGGLTGATFSPEAASKYLNKSDIPKTAAQLLKVGDAAGRILAKVAETPGVDVDPQEVAEAIDEAKGREDVSSRARNWGIGGGALGGLGGGALGYGAGALLSRNPWVRGGAAALGAIGGGAGGAYLGRQEGAEEAQADRLVSFLRGRRAFQTGAQEGYGQGMQHGYLAGLTGGQGVGEEEAGPQ